MTPITAAQRLTRADLLLAANVSEATADRLGLSTGVLVWSALCRGDGTVTPGVGHPGDGWLRAWAQALHLDVPACEAELGLQGLRAIWASLRHVGPRDVAAESVEIVADSGAWDFVSPNCECDKRHWDGGGEMPKCAQEEE